MGRSSVTARPAEAFREPMLTARRPGLAPLVLLLVASLSAALLGVPASAGTRPPGRVLVQSVSFTSSSDGWLLGVRRCGPGWCTVVRRTRDRGHRWTGVAAPPVSVGGDGPSRRPVTQLDAWGSADLFAYAPGLVVSHDGGAHWHTIHLPGAVVALASGGGWAYAAVGPCFQATRRCTAPGHLYRTPVGRDAWRRLPGIGFPAGQSPQISMHGSTIALLAGGPAAPQLLASSGGAGFVPVRDPCPGSLAAGGLAASGVAVASASSLAVLCVGGAGAGSTDKAVFVSTTFGRTFHRIADPPRGGDPGQLVLASPSTLVLAAASGASWLYRATGRDARWSSAVELGDGGVGFTDLSFSDPLHGSVVYGQATLAEIIAAPVPVRLAQLWLTNDGGRSWFAVAA